METITITMARYNELLCKEIAYEMLKADSDPKYWTSGETALHTTVDAFRKSEVE